MSSKRRRSLGGLLTVLWASALPCLCQTAPVVLITVDTLRADHTSPYGYSEAVTPAMAALAKDGVTFENAIVQVPITLPSHASILTSTYPMYHGLRDVVGRLNPDVPTIAEWFRQKEYSTAAFVGASVLSAGWGLDRGFDHYDDDFGSPSDDGPVEFDRVERTAGDVVDRVLVWVDSNRRIICMRASWTRFVPPARSPFRTGASIS